MRHGLHIVGSMLIALPALAQDKAPYLVTEANWTIVQMGPTRCGAFNRPLTEFNASPYNALWITQKAGDATPAMRIFFWPGAFSDGEAVKLTISFENGKSESLPAHAMGDYEVDADTWPSGLTAQFGESGATSFGRSQMQVTFDTTQLPKVLADLSECLAALPQN